VDCVCGRQYANGSETDETDETSGEKTVVDYKWYTGELRHKVIYSDGTYDMEDCAPVDCVCGRQYANGSETDETDETDGTSGEKTVVDYKWYTGEMRHKVIYSDGTYDMEDCATVDCVCGRPNLSEPKNLPMPALLCDETVRLGDDYTIFWAADDWSDYYRITCDSLNYEVTVDAAQCVFTIPGSIFEQKGDDRTHYTFSVVAMSRDSDVYLPSRAASVYVHVLGPDEARTLKGSLAIRGGVLSVITVFSTAFLVLSDQKRRG